MNLFNRLKGVVFKLFGLNSREIEKITDNKDINTDYYNRLERIWLPYFKQNDLNLQYDPCNRKLQAYSIICDKFAMYTSNEVDIKANLEDVNVEIQNLTRNLKTSLEYGFGLSGIVFKPYVKSGRLKIETVTPENYIILSMESKGIINKIAFINKLKQGKTYYTKFEIHDLTGYTSDNQNIYIIKNLCYKSDEQNGSLRPCSLQEVNRWANIPSMIQGLDIAPTFAFFTSAKANKYDFSNFPTALADDVMDIIIDADRTYSDFLREYRAKRTKAVIQDGAVPLEWQNDSRKIIKKYEDIDDFFLKVNNPIGDNTNAPLIEFIDGEIRNNAYESGINFILRQVENRTNLARGTLSQVDTALKTATEVIASSQNTVNAIKSEQRQLILCINQLENAIKSLGLLYGLNKYNTLKLEIIIGDGVLADKEKMKIEGINLVNNGLLSKKSFLVQYMGLDEEQAIEELKKIADEQMPITTDETLE